MSTEGWKDKEPAVVAIDQALDALCKHFQNVQIFCSRICPDPKDEDDLGATQRLIVGRGNFYSRLGQVRDWMTQEDEKTREEIRQKMKGERE